MTLFEDFKSRIKNVKSAGDGFTGLCPVHNDHENSLSFTEKGDKLLMKCHANQGCTYEDVLRNVGLWKDRVVETQPKKPRKIVAEYDYVDENGELLYQVVRFEPKDFIQRRPEGETGWSYVLKGIRRVLYNLPEIVERTSDTIYIVEGEKDADNLMKRGLLATTNSGGAGKWLKEYNKYFKDRTVVIIPDNDDPGRDHAELVARNLHRGASSIKIVKIGEEHKEDISTWLESHDVEELAVLVSQTEVFEWDGEEFDEEMPADTEAERAVIGAIFKDNSLIGKCIEAGLDKFLYLPAHRTIYKAIIACFSESKSIDVITVADRLTLDGTLDKVGGRPYLKLAEDDVPQTMAVDHWINVIISKAQLRNLINLGNKVKTVAYGEVDTPENISDTVVRSVFDIAGHQKRQGFMSLGRIVDNVIVRAREQMESGVTGIATGFMDFDEATSGLQETDLILIAGRPSMGKTAWALNIAANAALREAKNVAFFSLEMSKDALVRRILCSEARVDAQAFRNSQLTDWDWGRIAEVIPQFDEAKLFVDDTPAISVMEMRSKILNFSAEQGDVDLIVVDYLQLMSGDRRENRQQEVSGISRDLKSLAKEFEVPLVGLCQLSRSPETRADHRPLLSDLRESGSLEQDADVVAFLYRDEYYNPTDDNRGLAEVIIAKQRNGPLRNIDLGFLGNYNRFENLIMG